MRISLIHSLSHTHTTRTCSGSASQLCEQRHTHTHTLAVLVCLEHLSERTVGIRASVISPSQFPACCASGWNVEYFSCVTETLARAEEGGGGCKRPSLTRRVSHDLSSAICAISLTRACMRTRTHTHRPYPTPFIHTNPV